MAKLCQGWRKCVALVMMEEEEAMDQEIGEPVVQLKFSLPVVWVLIKRVKDGFMMRLQCGGSGRLWMQYDEPDRYHREKKLIKIRN